MGLNLPLSELEGSRKEEKSPRGREGRGGEGITEGSSSIARTPAAEVTVTEDATSLGLIMATAAICKRGRDRETMVRN